MKYKVEYRDYNNKLEYKTKSITAYSLDELQEQCHKVLVKTRALNDGFLIVFPKEYHFIAGNNELIISHNNIEFSHKTLVNTTSNPHVKRMYHIEIKDDGLYKSSIINVYSVSMMHFSFLNDVTTEELDLPIATIDISNIRHNISKINTRCSVDITVPGIDRKTKKEKIFEGWIVKVSENSFCLFILA